MKNLFNITLKPALMSALVGAAIAAIAGCAVQQVQAPAELKPPGEIPLMTLAANGVQIYECRKADAATKAAVPTPVWTFIAPEADLFDAQGRRIGRHGAGPVWQHEDGSRIIGTVRARVDAPRAADIPWLLLTTRPQGDQPSTGAFARVSSVQRLNTAGGQPPAGGCSAATLGQRVNIAYRADYVLHVPAR